MNDEGQEIVNTSWYEAALQEIRKLAQSGKRFTTDDVWEALEKRHVDTADTGVRSASARRCVSAAIPAGSTRAELPPVMIVVLNAAAKISKTKRSLPMEREILSVLEKIHDELKKQTALSENMSTNLDRLDDATSDLGDRGRVMDVRVISE